MIRSKGNYIAVKVKVNPSWMDMFDAIIQSYPDFNYQKDEIIGLISEIMLSSSSQPSKKLLDWIIQDFSNSSLEWNQWLIIKKG